MRALSRFRPPTGTYDVKSSQKSKPDLIFCGPELLQSENFESINQNFASNCPIFNPKVPNQGYLRALSRFRPPTGIYDIKSNPKNRGWTSFFAQNWSAGAVRNCYIRKIPSPSIIICFYLSNFQSKGTKLGVFEGAESF